MDGLLPTGRHQVSNTGTYVCCVFIAHSGHKVYKSHCCGIMHAMQGVLYKNIAA